MEGEGRSAQQADLLRGSYSTHVVVSSCKSKATPGYMRQVPWRELLVKRCPVVRNLYPIQSTGKLPGSLSDSSKQACPGEIVKRGGKLSIEALRETNRSLNGDAVLIHAFCKLKVSVSLHSFALLLYPNGGSFECNLPAFARTSES